MIVRASPTLRGPTAARWRGVAQTHFDAGGRRLRLATTAKARIAFIGNDGGGNLGDDAMRSVAQRLLSPARLETCASNYLERRLSLARLSGPAYFSAGLLGGGTLISPYELERTRHTVESGIPMWAIGTGVGSSGFEMASDVDISGWAPVLQRFAYVGVRGPRSARRLRQLGVDSEIVGDLALALALSRTVMLPAPTPTIAVNLGGSSGAISDGLDPTDVVTAAAAGLAPLRDAGWTILPFAMAPGDIPPLRRLGEALGVDLAILRAPDAGTLLDALGPCRLALTMRLHAAVLATCAGVPPLLIAYRGKCYDFMESLALGDWTLDAYQHLDALPARLGSLARQAPSLREPVLRRAQALGGGVQRRLLALRSASLT